MAAATPTSTSGSTDDGAGNDDDEVDDDEVDVDVDEDEDGDGQSACMPERSTPPVILHLPPFSRLTSYMSLSPSYLTQTQPW